MVSKKYFLQFVTYSGTTLRRSRRMRQRHAKFTRPTARTGLLERAATKAVYTLSKLTTRTAPLAFLKKPAVLVLPSLVSTQACCT